MKRYSSIDAVRVLAAFFIVFIHTPMPGVLGGMILPITRTAVPFFLMVSGFFLWNNDRKYLETKILQEIKKIFIIVVCSNLLYFMWDLLVNHNEIRTYLNNTFTVKNIGTFLLLNESPFAGHLWYLTAFLYVLIIYYFLNKFRLTNKIVKLIPILLVCDLVFGKYSILIFNREFSFLVVRNFIFVGIPYFLLGNIIRGRIENKRVNVSNKSLLFGMIIFSITSILEKYFLIAINANAIRDHYISTTLLIICIFVYLVKNPTLFKDNIFEKIGRKHSLFIYIVHPIIIFILNLIISKIGSGIVSIYSYTAVFIVFSISLICSGIYLRLIQMLTIKRKEKTFESFGSQ